MTCKPHRFGKMVCMKRACPLYLTVLDDAFERIEPGLTLTFESTDALVTNWY